MKMTQTVSAIVLIFALCSVVAINSASGVSPTVIFSEIVSNASSTVPGALDAGGQSVSTTWNSMFDLAMREDGSQWMVRGSTTQSTDLSNILVLGSGLMGTAFAQEGQPLLGGSPGELYDFFDGPRPVSWDSSGNMAFSTRAKGASSLEKLIRVTGGNHSLVLQQNDPAFGVIDNPPGNSGDETIGNSINSVHLLDSGEVGFINTPVNNLSSTRYPVFFLDQTAVRQSGVTAIGGQIWDNMDFDNSGGTPDGMHTFIIGDTEDPNTSMDGILAIDDEIALQEGTPVAGVFTPLMDAVFFARMLNDGTWFARGDDPANNDWAVRNGTLLASTGDLIAGTENWGDAIGGFTGNNLGDWIATGSTNHPDPNRDNVMVLNGSTVLLREGDGIDLDRNGVLDDDAFLRSFTPDDLFLMDNGDIYFLATLQNSSGTNLGDAFLYLPSNTITGDFDGDGDFDCDDVDPLVAVIAAASNVLSFDLTGDGIVNGDDLTQWLLEAGNFNVGGAYIPGDATLNGTVDGEDFIAWNAHKFSTTAAWCSADFNADGITDGLDFIIWNDNKFTSVAASGVPEPHSIAWIVAIIGLSMGFRRRVLFSAGPRAVPQC